MEGVNNVYMQIDYTGDKGYMFFNQILVADHYFNGDIWEIGLNRLEYSLDNQPLIIDITPLSKDARIYFDDDNAKNEGVNAFVKNVSLISEYMVEWDACE